MFLWEFGKGFEIYWEYEEWFRLSDNLGRFWVLLRICGFWNNWEFGKVLDLVIIWERF